MASYPWFASVSGPQIEQGDIISNCLRPEIPVLSSDTGTSDERGIVCTAVVITQSCDIAKGIDVVMLAPLIDLKDWLDGHKDKPKPAFDKLRKAQYMAYHVIDSCQLDGHVAPHRVVSFSQAFSVPFAYLSSLLGTSPRIRLLPPYREQLAQHFARYYMRVALPMDVSTPDFLRP